MELGAVWDVDVAIMEATRAANRSRSDSLIGGRAPWTCGLSIGAPLVVDAFESRLVVVSVLRLDEDPPALEDPATEAGTGAGACIAARAYGLKSSFEVVAVSPPLDVDERRMTGAGIQGACPIGPEPSDGAEGYDEAGGCVPFDDAPW